MATKPVKKPSSKIIREKGLQGADPSTIMRIQEAAKMLSKGKSRATIMQHLMDTYSLANSTAAVYYAQAVKFLLPDNEDEYKDQLIRANVTRLETIYEKAMERGDYKNAREAIAELNKMAGLHKEGISVGISNDKENDTQQVIIHFDK